MLRLAVVSAFLLFVRQDPAQMFSHGIPAGATSPEPDGRQHGIPSNVQSPTPLPPGVHPPGAAFNFFHGPLHRFGNPHRKVLVPVPVFYPIYGYGDAGYPADPYVQPAPDQAQAPAAAREQDDAADASSEDSLRQAYLQGARDALQDERDRARYGEHYLDSREQQRLQTNDTPPPPRSSHSSEAAARSSRSDEAPAATPVKEDTGPATVFIFKDGHQIETRNFAIMGETLFDFS